MAWSVSMLPRSGVLSSLTTIRRIRSPYHFNGSLTLLLCAVMFLFLGVYSSAQSSAPSPQQTTPKQKTTQKENSPQQTTPPPKGVHDIIAKTFSATCNGDPDNATQALDVSAIQPQLDLLAKEKDLDWSGTELFKIAKQAVPSTPANVVPDQAYIFHVDHWTSAHVLVSSDWFVYRGTKAGK